MTGPPTVVAADDDFHPVTSDDPAWIETCWFPFWVQDRGLTVYVRIWVTPNAGIEGGAVSVWRGAGDVVFAEQWTRPFEGFGDLRDLRLPNGLTIRAVEPLWRYAVAFPHPDCSLDLTFDGVMEPHAVDPEESPGMFAGHFEQPGMVRGTMRLHGEEIVVDCPTVRDRSWGPRVVQQGLRIGNLHSTTDDRHAFFGYVRPDGAGGEAVTSGYLLHDGVASEIVSGSRETEWDGDFPAAVRLQAVDRDGRTIDARGRCVNRQAIAAQHDLYAVLNLVRWEYGGVVGWGENHDVWSKQEWVAAGRAPLS